jgi:arginyl-tRNA synthetase
MLKQRILEDLKKAVEDLGYDATDIVCSIPKSSEFGEYTTNVALQLAKQKEGSRKQNPVEIANEIVEKLKNLEANDYLERMEVVNGFINFYIKPEALLSSLHKVCDYSNLVNPEVELEGSDKKKIMVEYTDPNPFKAFHIGHLFTNTVGESLARLLEATGGDVKRVNYYGDVGMHVAKSIWGMIQKLEKEGITLKELEKKDLSERIEFLGQAYASGASAFEEDKTDEIKDLNRLVYIASQQYMAETSDYEPEIDYAKDIKLDHIKLKTVKNLYAKGRQWSLEYFETIYQTLGTKFDYYYPESTVGEFGIKTVKDHLEDGTFKESEGAIIFPGEQFGLHNRVFINSMGLPTYEAKELGLAIRKYQDFKYDQSIVITGNEINDYFKVLMMALSQIEPDLAKKTTHIGHGMLRMTEGKMSSRTGNVITFEWLYEEIKKQIEKLMEEKFSAEEKEQIIRIVSIGALKFTLLKHQPTSDFIFDLKASVSLQGDSGPYIQYSYARAKSVLRNAKFNYDLETPHSDVHPKEVDGELEKEERELLQKIEHFPTIVEDAALSLHPNIIATFLLEMSSLFNLFYQKHQIILGDKTELRLAITCAVAIVLKQGLYLLGIEAPERM